MKKLIAIVLAATMLESGCCTVLALSEDQTWVTPITVPADVALLPVEFLCWEVFLRYETGGHCGVFGFLDIMGQWH